MEYTFKNSIRESAQTILLQRDCLSVQFPEREESFKYDRILSVKLTKSKHNLFALELIFDKGYSILITNKYFLSSKECEDRSHSYDTFVRVLHFHLQEKGRAKYYSGFTMKYVVTLMLGAAFGSFVISFISEYFSFSVTNSLTQAFILTVLAVVVILVANRKFFTKGYSPLNIPLEFLPRCL
jgi:hypothetical protein